jgi:hypothetical protein
VTLSRQLGAISSGSFVLAFSHLTHDSEPRGEK